MENNFSLSEILYVLQDLVSHAFSQPVWVRAEIGELRENNEHCYMELIEKDENSDNLLAKVRANCWASTYRILKPYFESETGQILAAGLSVLVCVTAEFHPVYGISLNIKDIEPKFTMGEIALRRRKIIKRLEADGVMEMNKMLDFPKLPQRIAVISSATAAGYGDFIHQLKNNDSGFAFYSALFQSIMQGEQSAASIISALDRIYQHADWFDAVVIIRGGGATSDLASFDNYALALNCAQFPLPILTGIGHQRDLSVVDMIAHESLKTPTAVAEYLVKKMQTAEDELFNYADLMADCISRNIEKRQNVLDTQKRKIEQHLRSTLERRHFEIEKNKIRLENAFSNRLTNEKNKIALFDRILQANSPFTILQKGYSLTTLNGHKITSAKMLAAGDQINSIFSDGEVKSVVF